ncbi:unnamed protein product [Sphenostylis stenocarpa]|uniref:Uncharacterized protein n=1 Tax=Sphenostylis stenocarpa TaxID=92480 RepID=A0AA86W2S2_9FABA|nr:unnamed protein product [Sphenostylis stenocarpa]
MDQGTLQLQGHTLHTLNPTIRASEQRQLPLSSFLAAVEDTRQNKMGGKWKSWLHRK